MQENIPLGIVDYIQILFEENKMSEMDVVDMVLRSEKIVEDIPTKMRILNNMGIKNVDLILQRIDELEVELYDYEDY